VVDTEQLFQAIRKLSVPERLRLVERVVHDLAEGTAATPPAATEPTSLMGLFADEPDMIDDVCTMAMAARRRDPWRAGSGGDEGTP
jgi:hypothetical protein